MAIDFTFSESQQDLQNNAQAFAEAVLRPTVERIDRAGDPWEAFVAGREAYREMAKAVSGP
jgi:alkylation response protein AidB-like acyl-CoA dehydrogenase